MMKPNRNYNTNYSNTNYYDPRYTGQAVPAPQQNYCPCQSQQYQQPYVPYWNYGAYTHQQYQQPMYMNPSDGYPQPSTNYTSTSDLKRRIEHIDSIISGYYLDPNDVIRIKRDEQCIAPLYENNHFPVFSEKKFPKPNSISDVTANKVLEISNKDGINIINEVTNSLNMEFDKEGYVTKFTTNNPMDNEPKGSYGYFDHYPFYNAKESTVYTVEYGENHIVKSISGTNGYKYTATYDDSGRKTSSHAEGKSSLYTDQGLLIRNDERLNCAIPSTNNLMNHVDDRHTNGIVSQDQVIKYFDDSNEASNIKITTTRNFKMSDDPSMQDIGFDKGYDITTQETLEFNRPEKRITKENPWEINYSMKIYSNDDEYEDINIPVLEPIRIPTAKQNKVVFNA